MSLYYSIHPSIGIARVGNSPTEFYLAPETIGGLPTECDQQGDPAMASGKPTPVSQFKDAQGRVKRQAARFQIFRHDDQDPNGPGQPVILEDTLVESIEWTVHLANKKAAWYQFSELEGDLMLGPDNSYQQRGVPLRNPDVQGQDKRRKLIIDPGPRGLAGRNLKVQFSRDNIPSDYPFGSFPDPKPTQGLPINTLGELMTDSQGQLLVLGGYGHAGGNEPITTFAGANTWHDDISDGPVTARIILKSGEVVQANAWVIVGSPKFAPELVNIVTLDDVIYDAAVRYKGFVPDLYDEARWPGNHGWNPDYQANYSRDIQPILDRLGGYRWVANVPSMTTFAAPPFDAKDNSQANRASRQNFFRYFRHPEDFFRAKLPPESAPQHQQLLSDNGVPLLPLNSGSNSVSNTLIDKFMSLTPTQWYLLHQWAAGKFGAQEDYRGPGGVHPLDRASVGNCVGHPMCPGIEVTWSTRNPALYQDLDPYSIKQRHREAYYKDHGLSPSEDETDGQGCEPGDLTKRMAIPWQADFFQCSIQYINFTDPEVNKTDSGIPVPPTFYAYWWPPQSPWDVISGAMTEAEQQLAGVPGGIQVNYARGVNSFAQMITAWCYLGFVLNQNSGPDRDHYPYFVERERNHDRFTVSSVAVGQASNVLNAQDVNFMPVLYLKPDEDTKVDTSPPATRAGRHAT